MSFIPEALRKQNEAIRALRRELAAKERELADQKWIFEHFLQSPAWRITAPFRWVVRQFRKLNSAGQAPATPKQEADAEYEPSATDESFGLSDPSSDPKHAFAALCQVSLENFLSSGSVLKLPRSGEPLVSVILVVFNRAELTFACLRSIAESDQKLEIVIVDNASTDDTSQLLARVEGARILRNPENVNFLLAVNQAARTCRGNYILLLNNDAQLLPGALDSVLATIQSSDEIGAVGGKIILLDGTLQEAGSIVWSDGSCLGYGRGDHPFAPSYMFRRDVDYCSGAFLLTPRSVWEELGGFDESFKPAYYEETDYCMRLRRKGMRVVYEPAAAILHFEFASSTTSSAAIELQIRNQKHFVERNRTELQKHEPPHPDRLVHARARHRGRRVLFLDDRAPHLWLGSGFPRAHTMLMALLKAGCFITIFPLGNLPESWTDVYTDIPREVEVMLGFDGSVLQSFLGSRKGYYDTIIVSRPHNMQVLAPLISSHPEQFENTFIIYDAEAVFAFRDSGLRELTGQPMSGDEFIATLSSEIQLAALADLVISVSESERDTLVKRGIPRVEVLGHSISVNATNVPFSSRSGLLFVGAIHEEECPNSDSVIWFVEEVLPKIHEKLPDVTLTIAGPNSSSRVRALAGPKVQLTGHVLDLTPLYAQSKLLIAPTRYGAGIPHKIHESAARGLPVVATPMLAEQLRWTEQEIAFSRDAAGFAERCVDLYTNEMAWTRLRNAALERVRAECSPQHFEEKIGQILKLGKITPATVR